MRVKAAQVTPSGSILFFPEGNRSGYLEYYPDSVAHPGTGDKAKNYRVRKKGEFQTPFFSSRGQVRELVLFSNPKTLLKWDPNIFENKNQTDLGVLGLLEPNLEIVHRTIATQKRLNRVRVILDL